MLKAAMSDDRAPMDRLPALRHVRRILMKNPTLVRIAKDIYRSPIVSRTKPFQWFVHRRAAAADAALPRIVPRVSIETVLTCNARCSMCVHSEKKMVGVMEMDLFRRLVDELAEWGAQEVSLSVYGEPLIDKKWRERVKIVRDAGLRYGFFSNASMLTEELGIEMLEMGGWTEVNFSVNGFSKPVYEAVMPPLKRDRVYRNIERFAALKVARGLTEPRVTISCVCLEENHRELGEFRRFWESVPGVDRVSIADRSDWLGELKKTDTARAVGRRLRVLAPEVWEQPCASIWSSLYVYADGRVAPCCEDAGLRELIVGDANRSTLREIFLGEALTTLRAEHRADRRTTHAQCGNCRVNWPWI